MAKFNPKDVYGVLFTTVDNFSDKDQEYLFENIFTDEFLQDVKNNPKSAYNTLDKIVQNIENGKQDKVSKLFSDYKDKLYMMKNMLKDYGNF